MTARGVTPTLPPVIAEPDSSTVSLGQEIDARLARIDVSFNAHGFDAYGVSRDSLKSHAGFSEKMDFPFPLLSDPDEALCKEFDVIRMKNMYGKEVRGIERSTFVIGRDGVLAREWRKVKVPGHAQEVLDFVKTL